MAQQLFFTCPETTQRVFTGIQMDPTTLKAFWTGTLNIHCPGCGKVHDISVREAYVNSTLSNAYP
jgi:hypothetical protein